MGMYERATGVSKGLTAKDRVLTPGSSPGVEDDKQPGLIPPWESTFVRMGGSIPFHH